MNLSLKGVLKGTGIITLANVAGAIFSFLFIPIVINKVGLDGYGSFVLYTTSMIVFQKLSNLQTWQISTKEGIDNDEVFFRFIGIDIVLGVIGGISYFVFFMLYYHSVEGQDSLLIGLFVASCIPVLSNSSLLAYFRNKEKFLQISIYLVCAPFLRLVILLNYNVENEIELVGIFLISEIIKCFILFHGYWGALKQFNLRGGYKSINNKKDVFWSWLSGISDLPVQAFDRLLIGALLGAEMAGVYHAIRRVGNVVTQFSAPVYQVIYQYFIRLNKNVIEQKILIRKITILLLLMNFTIVLLAFTLHDFWFEKFFEEVEVKWLVYGYLLCVSVVTALIYIHPLYMVKFGVKSNAITTLVFNVIFLFALCAFLNYISVEIMLFLVVCQMLLIVVYKILKVYNYDS